MLTAVAYNNYIYTTTGVIAPSAAPSSTAPSSAAPSSTAPSSAHLSSTAPSSAAQSPLVPTTSSNSSDSLTVILLISIVLGVLLLLIVIMTIYSRRLKIIAARKDENEEIDETDENSKPVKLDIKIKPYLLTDSYDDRELQVKDLEVQDLQVSSQLDDQVYFRSLDTNTNLAFGVSFHKNLDLIATQAHVD